MENIEIISALLGLLVSAIVAVYSMIIKNSTKKNSNQSEKLLFELKQVNDDVNNKIREVIVNSDTKNNHTFGFTINQNDDVIIQANEKKLDELIHNHHSQALSQSKIQFWFSLIAAVIGFIFIIVTVCLASTNIWYEYVVSVLPGAIIEGVSILFFSQSRETRERSSDFLNRLREDRQYEKGIAIAESISDEQLKSILKAEIALRLCGINDINIFEKEKHT